MPCCLQGQWDACNYCLSCAGIFNLCHLSFSQYICEAGNVSFLECELRDSPKIIKKVRKVLNRGPLPLYLESFPSCYTRDFGGRGQISPRLGAICEREKS